MKQANECYLPQLNEAVTLKEFLKKQGLKLIAL
jgi:hypothetical protein